jgi:hypothetical protein
VTREDFKKRVTRGTRGRFQIVDTTIVEFLMEAEATISISPVPILSGDRDALTMDERQDSLHKALQWVRDELVSIQCLYVNYNTKYLDK